MKSRELSPEMSAATARWALAAIRSRLSTRRPTGYIRLPVVGKSHWIAATATCFHITSGRFRTTMAEVHGDDRDQTVRRVGNVYNLTPLKTLTHPCIKSLPLEVRWVDQQQPQERNLRPAAQNRPLPLRACATRWTFPGLHVSSTEWPEFLLSFLSLVLSGRIEGTVFGKYPTMIIS